MVAAISTLRAPAAQNSISQDGGILSKNSSLIES